MKCKLIFILIKNKFYYTRINNTRVLCMGYCIYKKVIVN